MKQYTFEDVQRKIYDSKTWTSLSRQDFIHAYDPERYVFRNIKKIFSKEQLDAIKAAFESKVPYSCWKYGSKRDYHVNVQIEDGGDKLEAWFSSEYAGTGNGDYYLLLNPTTAVFMEHD